MRVTGAGRRNMRRALFAAYLTGFLIVAVILAYVQPLLDMSMFLGPPDEHTRYMIPRFICENGYLPTGFEETVRVEGYNISYAFHPILPYIIMGYLMRALSFSGAGEEALLFAARAVNIVSGLCMACVLYLIARRVFEKPAYRWLFCFGVMYLPQQLFLHTYVNTESMCMLAITLLIHALIRMYQDAPRAGNAAELAAGAVILLLTYYNAYGYLVSAALLYILYFWNAKREGGRRMDWRAFFRNALPVLLCVLVCAGWWFLREAILLDGDFTGLATNARLRGENVTAPAAQGIGLIELFRTRPLLEETVQSFIARYGSMSITASPRYYFVYECYLGAGLVLSTLHLYRNRGADARRKRFAACMFLAVLLNILLWVYYIYRNDYQPQGRYLLPSVIPVYYLVCRGYGSVTSRLKGRYAENAAVTVLTLFVITALCHYVFKLCLPVYLMLRTA